MVKNLDHIPDLAPLCPRLSDRLLLKDMFIGNSGLDRNALLLRRSFVRLVEKAVGRFTAARQVLIDEIAEAQRPNDEMLRTGRILYAPLFIDLMEDCLITCRRIARFLSALKQKVSEISMDRDTRRKIESLSPRIRTLRDKIEHMAEQISNGSVLEGDFIAPYATEDGKGVSLAGHFLSFDDLAEFMKLTYLIAADLVEVGPNTSVTADSGPLP